MPKYRIQTNDGRTFVVDADSQELALSALGTTAPAGKKPDSKASKAVDAMPHGLLPEFMQGMQRKIMQGATLGWNDEISAFARALGTIGSPKTLGQRYADEKAIEDELNKRATANTGAAGTAAEMLGGLATGAGAMRGGLTLAKEGASLASRVGRGAVEGAAYGGVQGAGSTEGNKLSGAANGALIGAGVGAGLPLVISAARGVGSGVLSNIEAARNPGAYADRKIAQAAERSGLTEQQILDDYNAASGMPYSLADALDYEGRRLLSTVTKAPGAGRQEALGFLHDRQADQPDRVVRALREGFNAPRTAQQTEDALRAQRTAEAAVNYGAARNSAGSVNPTDAINLANDFLEPGVNPLMRPGSTLPDDTVEAVVRRARDMLTNGREMLTDFPAAFRTKRNIDAMIDNANPTQQRELIPIRNALDDALANASEPYAAARDRFRAQSQQIEAVGAGREAAGPPLAQDVVPGFSVRPAEQQGPFRAGFVDPLITRIVNNPAPGANAAKFSPNMRAKINAFAEPDQAENLLARLMREQRMHQTLTEAAGGSKTVENAADAADMAIDPAIFSNLLSGQFRDAALAGARGIWNTLSGNTEPVRNELARRLLPLAGSEPVEVMLPRVTGELRRKRGRNAKIERDLVMGLTFLGSQAGGRAQ